MSFASVRWTMKQNKGYSGRTDLRIPKQCLPGHFESLPVIGIKLLTNAINALLTLVDFSAQMTLMA